VAKKPAAAAQRAHVYYGGKVQGVGFRFTAESIAHRVGVQGFVKNLPDGRVEIVCEGPKERIDSFLCEILQSPLGRHIRKTDCCWEEPTGSFTDFTIEFHY
jgi:acylphosphatase